MNTSAHFPRRIYCELCGYTCSLIEVVEGVYCEHCYSDCLRLSEWLQVEMFKRFDLVEPEKRNYKIGTIEAYVQRNGE